MATGKAPWTNLNKKDATAVREIENGLYLIFVKMKNSLKVKTSMVNN